MMSEMKMNSSPMKEEFNSILSFTKNNKFLIYVAIFTSIFAYGFSLTHFTLSIDEEVALNRGNQYNWSSQGRFGLDVLKVIFHFWNTNSITSTFLAVSLFSISSILWVYAFYSITPQKDDKYIPGIIIVLLFLTFPAYSENIGFSMMSFELGIGWILVALAAIIISKWAISPSERRSFFIVGVVLVTFVTSIYQAFLSVFIIGCFIQIFLYILNMEKMKKKLDVKSYFSILMKIAVVSFVSLILYKIIDIIIQFYNPSSGYIENFIMWGKKPPLVIIHDLLTYFSQLVRGEIIYGAKALLPSLIICLFLLFYFLVKLVTKKHSGNAGILIVSLIGCSLTPFLIYIVSGSTIPVRGNLVWPLFTSSMCLFFYLLIRNFQLHRIILLMVCLVSFYQANAISQLFYSDYQRYEEDVKLANQVGYSIVNLDLGDNPSFPVVYVGRHEQQQRNGIIKQEVLGFSFFEWDGGNQLRISDFMQSLGYNYLFPTVEQKEKAEQIAASMPMWPHNGSVALKENMIIVNFSSGEGKPLLEISENKPALGGDNYTRLSIDSLKFDSNNVTLTKQTNGTLHASSNVEDPFFTFSVNSFTKDHSYEFLKIQLNSDTDGEMQLFLLPSNGEYNEILSGTHKIHSGNNIIYCTIPRIITKLSAVRIDPPSNSILSVENIELFR